MSVVVEELREVSAESLLAELQQADELALIDVRETGDFAHGHILYANPVPLWRIELDIARKVPRKAARIVLTDGQGESAPRVAAILRRLGYGNLAILKGGLQAWKEAGFEVFSGENVPSKALGELVEVQAHTPHISARQLHERIQSGENLVIVDGRTPEEFFNFSLPGAHSIPNIELPYRIRELAPDPATPIVVNCAGRTRSIIGAQTLIDAGVPNPIVSLQDGTMAWLVEGFELDHGKRSALPEPDGEHLRQAHEHAARLLARAGVAVLDEAGLAALQADTERSLFLFDVRTQQEYRAGHLPGWRWAPGGQLVQATDEYIGTLGARVVIADWDGVRAASAAAWLVQLGKFEVHVYRPVAPFVLETGDERITVLKDPDTAPHAWISQDEAASLLERDAAIVIDVDPIRTYLKKHIRAAYAVVAERIEATVPTLAQGRALIITSSDGVLANLVATRLGRQGTVARALLGGNRAWFEAGRASEAGLERYLSGERYLWLSGYDHADNTRRNQAFREYLDWELGLVEQLRRKGAEAPLSVLGAAQA